MLPTSLFKNFFSSEIEEFELLDESILGKIYVDVPHRYFGTIEDLKDYVKKVRNLGANVLLLLPHFYPSFSEYVVKDYEKPCSLFGTWDCFAEFMSFVADLGMDRMIDIPFNHADWEALNLKRYWYKNFETNGIEAGADDIDADGNRVRINWGAYVLNNADPELSNYWLEKVIYPHVKHFNVNCIRIDAAWGLDPEGLKRIIQGTKERFPHVWFVAENLGMNRLINLAESALNAGAERYFNNFYWYTGGRYIPSDMYRFKKRSNGKPTCTIFSSHDVLMPAMRALSLVRKDSLGKLLNDKAIHRQIVEREKVKSVSQLSIEERERLLHIMKLEFLLSAFVSTDLMWVAGSEEILLERVDVLQSGPEHFARGIKSDFPSFITGVLRVRASDPIFNSEGTIIPFGAWERGKTGCRGYVKKSDKGLCLVAVNLDLDNHVNFKLPTKILKTTNLRELSLIGFRRGSGSFLPAEITLEPGQALILYSHNSGE